MFFSFSMEADTINIHTNIYSYMPMIDIHQTYQRVGQFDVAFHNVMLGSLYIYPKYYVYEIFE